MTRRVVQLVLRDDAYVKGVREARRATDEHKQSVLDADRTQRTSNRTLRDSRQSYREMGDAARDYGRDAERAHERASRAARASARDTGLVAGAMRKLRGLVASYLVFASAEKIGRGAQAAFETASALQETENAFVGTFGTATAAVRSFVAETANMAGQTQREAKETISSFGGIGTGIELAGDDLATFAREAYEAAADLQSYRNLPVGEAFDRMRSAITGSSEVLDQFGVNIKEAALAEYAAAQGITTSTKSMSEQEKVLLRLAKIRSDLRRQGALGDLVKTQDSDANRVRALTAAYRESAEVASVKLLPSFALVADAAEEMYGTLDGSTIGDRFARWVFERVADARRFFRGLMDVASAGREFFGVLRAGQPQVSGTTDEVQLQTVAIYKGADAISAGAAAWARFLARIQRIRSGVQSAVASMVRAVVGGVDSMATALQGFSLGGLTDDLGIDTPFGRVDLPDLKGLQNLENAVQGMGNRLGDATERGEAFASSLESAARQASVSADMYEGEARRIEDNTEARRKNRDVLEGEIEMRRRSLDMGMVLPGVLPGTPPNEPGGTVAGPDGTAKADADRLAKRTAREREAAQAFATLMRQREEIARAVGSIEREAIERVHRAEDELASARSDYAEHRAAMTTSAQAQAERTIELLETELKRAQSLRTTAAAARMGLGLAGGQFQGREAGLDPLDTLSRELASTDGFPERLGQVLDDVRTRSAQAATDVRLELVSSIREADEALRSLGDHRQLVTTDKEREALQVLIDKVSELREKMDAGPSPWHEELAEDLYSAARAADDIAYSLQRAGAARAGSIVQAGANVLGAGAQIASGNPVAMLSGAIEMVGALGELKTAIFGDAEQTRRQIRAADAQARATEANTRALLDSGQRGAEVSRDMLSGLDALLAESRRQLGNTTASRVFGTTGYSEAQDAISEMLSELATRGLDVGDFQQDLATILDIGDPGERRRQLYTLLDRLESRFGQLSDTLGTYGDALSARLALFEDSVRNLGLEGQDALDAFVRLVLESSTDLGDARDLILRASQLDTSTQDGRDDLADLVATAFGEIVAGGFDFGDELTPRDVQRLLEQLLTFTGTDSGAGASDASTSRSIVQTATLGQMDTMIGLTAGMLRTLRSIEALLTSLAAPVASTASAPVPSAFGGVDVDVALTVVQASDERLEDAARRAAQATYESVMRAGRGQTRRNLSG